MKQSNFCGAKGLYYKKNMYLTRGVNRLETTTEQMVPDTHDGFPEIVEQIHYDDYGAADSHHYSTGPNPLYVEEIDQPHYKNICDPPHYED
jgi:hypothetical protein